MTLTISDDLCLQAQNIRQKLKQELGDIVDSDRVRKIITEIVSISEPTSFGFIPDKIGEEFSRIEETYGTKNLGKFCKFVVLSLVDVLPATLSSKKIPQNILDFYPNTVLNAIDAIEETNDEEYIVGGEFFTKDFRLMSGRTLPAGAQIFDVPTFIPESVYRNRGYKNNLQSLFYVKFKLKGLYPMLRIHTDPRSLGDFNEQGWNECYGRIAEFMLDNPEIRGMVGTSWFYDPQLESVSPRLAYLRLVPQRNGAHVIIDGTSNVDIERATQTSGTRRKMYEKGEYMPTCCTLIWSRGDMIKWAKKNKYI